MMSDSERSSYDDSEVISLSATSSTDEDEGFDELKISLLDCLGAIKTIGEFADSRHYLAFPNPGLQIEGLSPIPLPLTPSSAEVIKNACRRAPFGKGDATIVDTSVRDTWELNPKNFRLANPAWEPFLAEVLQNASSGLGLLGVSAKLYKLLLYEEGSFFKRHKDSEKAPGMIGTLVICLPSVHQGGDVQLSFGTETRVLATGPSSAFDLTALAWFSDVTHEVKKLISGYRLVLTYNLIRSGAGPQSALSHREQTQAIQRLLLKWQADFPFARALLYPLDHQYTEKSLSLRDMKGRDFAVCQSLSKVCSTNGLYLFFAHLTRSEDEDEYSGKPEICTVLNNVYAPNGQHMMWSLEIEPDEILDSELFNDRDPDSEDEGEYTGNENMPATCRYHVTVTMIVAKQRLHEYLEVGRVLSVNVDNMVSWVNKDLEEHQDDPVTKSSALVFMERAIAVREMPLSLTPSVVAKRAMEWNMDDLYQAAIEKSIDECGNQDKILAVISQHLSQRYADGVKDTSWDKWLGKIPELMTSLTGMHRAFQKFQSLLTREPLRVSFQEWRMATMRLKLQSKPELSEDDQEFIVELIASQQNNLEWTYGSLLPILTSRGTRGLLCQTLSTVFKRRKEHVFAASKNIFERILENITSKLSLEINDFYNIRELSPAYPRTSNYSSLGLPIGNQFAYQPQTVDHPSDYLHVFVTLVDETLQLGLPKHAEQMLEASQSRLRPIISQWSATDRSAGAVFERLGRLASSLERHNIPPSPSLKSFFELVLQRCLDCTPPAKPARYAHKPRRCNSPSCGDCDALCRFLMSAEQPSWSFSANMSRRKHVQGVLPYGIFGLETVKIKPPHTLVVTKLGKEHEQEMAKFERERQLLRDRLEPLRGRFMRELLGAGYEEMVLLESPRAGKAQTVNAKGKRPATRDGECVILGSKKVKKSN